MDDAVSSPPRVLLVDDEVEYTETLAKVLRRRGLEVKVANGGEAALAAIEKTSNGGRPIGDAGGRTCPPGDAPFDVVLLDVKMPHMDGTELLGLLRARCPALSVILMTGHLQAGGGDELPRREAFAFLLKPHPLPELLELIAQAAARARARRAAG